MLNKNSFQFTIAKESLSTTDEGSKCRDDGAACTAESLFAE